MIGCAVPGVARAAEYSVHACDDAAHNQNHLFTPSASHVGMSTDTQCDPDVNGHEIGMAAMAGVNRGTVPWLANSQQTFLAPSGTTIRHMRVKADAATWNGDWATLLQASTDHFGSSVWNVSGCLGSPGATRGCNAAVAAQDRTYDFAGATGFRSVVACGNTSGCTTFGTGSWPFSRAYYFMREVDVTLDDPSAPTVTLTDGGLASGGWVRGTQAVKYNASDNSGILRNHFTVDDLGIISTHEERCDFAYAVPCSDVRGAEYSVDTARLSDGPHRMWVDAADATGATWMGAPMTAYVDNHAPAEPVSPVVEGGEGWHTIDGFTIHWANPSSAAPITRAYYSLCEPGGERCTSGSQDGSGITQLTGISVGQPGDYTIRVWLMDGAGNVSEAKSEPLHLKFDNVPPAQAAPQHRNGWVDKAHADDVEQRIEPSGKVPVSGIAGYGLTSDGSAPGGSVDIQASGDDGYAALAKLHDLPEGTTTVKARAISGAGIPSGQVGSTDIHVDLTPPTVSAVNAPDAQSWSRRPATVLLEARDPDELSGMASGPDDRDIEAGGYVVYAVDGAAPERARGPRRDLGPDGRLGYARSVTATVGIATDGVHSVTYSAFDVAGNRSTEGTVTVKIDQTPPELAVFEPQERTDPRRIAVAASDRTSGLGDSATIKLRRLSPTRGSWITLQAARREDHYFAHVDNTLLPEGDYEFQASVPDQAGNEAIATADRQGREEVIHISPTQIGPYTTIVQDGGAPSSGLDGEDQGASVDTVVRAWAIKTSCVQLRSVKTCPSSSESRTLVHELRVPFGRRAATKGVLTTAAGSPLADAEITVLERLAMAGGQYLAVASVRTNSSGAFKYTAPAGSSRTLDFHYRGDSKYKHADDQVALRVPAAVTISASRHAVRNGQRVRFSGKLRGRPYPERGKVLDLQAYYRHKWRTFATPRAARGGKWERMYRFGATRGVVLYKFRVRVRATSDYPFELGYSRVTKVRVRGR
jgi:hypothetical protein